MTRRRLYLDTGVGERRGVVTLDGRAERLFLERDGDAAAQALGARSVARVRRVERAVGLAFLELVEGPDAVLNLNAETGRLIEGQSLEIEIRAESRGDKGAVATLNGPAEGPPRLLSAGPTLEARLRQCDGAAEIQTGAVARTVADAAQREAMESVFPLTGGGSIAIEPTRALIAIDVDVGARAGTEAKRVARAANFEALGAAARLLRLKGLGGLVVIDLVGRGHDGPALLNAARAAFGPDNPGVSIGPASRFGTMELTLPRRTAPAIGRLAHADGTPTLLTQALDAVRALEREALSDRGGRFVLITPEAGLETAAPLVEALAARVGARLSLRGEPGRPAGWHEVARA